MHCLQVKYGAITYDTTFENYTMLTGNLVSLFLGGIICAVVSFIFPEDYDFLSMRQIKVLDVAEDGDLGFAKVSHDLHSLLLSLLSILYHIIPVLYVVTSIVVAHWKNSCLILVASQLQSHLVHINCEKCFWE